MMKYSALNTAFRTALILKFRCSVSGVLIIFLLMAGIVFNFGWLPSALAATDCSAVTEIPQAECEALLTLYNSTDGPNWSDSETNKWNTDNSPSGWGGITLSAGHVIKLYRDNKNLNGSVPSEIGDLTNLKYLDLEHNQLNGPIPPELGNLTNMNNLYLSNNQLSGPVPHEFVSLTNLSYLRLSYNKLTALDVELFDFLSASEPGWADTQTLPPTDTAAKILTENSIRISWTPVSYGGYYLIRYGDSAGGPYAGESSTADISASNYDVTGLSPGTYFFVVETYTPAHDDQQNNLTSDPSSEVSATVAGEPSAAKISDPVPGSELSSTTVTFTWNDSGADQYWLRIGTKGTGSEDIYSDGQGTDTSKTIFGLPNSGETLYLRLYSVVNEEWLYNDYTYTAIAEGETDCAAVWEIPQAECEALVALFNSTDGPNWDDSAHNRWNTDSSPSSWMGVTVSAGHVTGLDRNHRNLNGSLPAELGNLTNLEILFLIGNELSGSVPSELGNLTNLELLLLSNNQLSGPVPPELGNLNNLQYLRLSDNELSGHVPPELGNMANLEILYLSSNELSGSVPSELGNLTNLEHLNLSNNQLSGPVPSELGSLTKLKYFNLDDNQLSGHVPPELSNLTVLKWLYLKNNQLSGPVPSELVNLTSLKYLSLSYNKLTASDAELFDFLSALEPGWTDTQTLPPTDTAAEVLTGNSVRISWTPVSYGEYYQIRYGNNAGGPYTGEAATADISASSYDVTGLSPGTYFFVVETYTPAHDDQQNNLTSEPSSEVSATVGVPIAEISDPVPGSELSSTTVTFTWNDSGADQYWMRIGTTGAGSEDIYSDDQGTNTSKKISGLPDNGETLYLRLYSVVNGEWLYNDYTYTAMTETGGTDCAAVWEIPQAECEALVALYNSTDGPNWGDSATNKWNTDNSPSDWTGVTVSAGHVTRLYRSSKNLTGYLPAELENLTNLETLSLRSNELSGPIPPELGNMTNLKSLYLLDNKLNGPVPPELGNLINLESLSLYINKLSGPVPPELGNLTNLKFFSLFGNELSGPVPPELENLTNLEYLYLYDNQLSGPVPPELGNLTNLKSLSLQDNELSGPVPVELESLINLESLDLSGNQLSGAVPVELGNLINLRHLCLSSNQLSGSVPAELGNLTNLKKLWLRSNQLSGPVPPELGNLTILEYLFLSDNQLSGPVPPELGNLINLEWLYLSGNQLSGPVPPELVNLTNLRYLNLDYNKLTASDEELLIFLSTIDSGWADNQTLPPTNTVAEALTENSVRISWTPVSYGGYYLIRYGNSAGGPYAGEAATADISVSSYDITGLSPGTYYFVIETYTPAHGSQQNNLTSDPSPEVSAAVTAEPSAAEISAPVSGSTLNSGTETFTWNDTGAEKYWLWIGTSEGGNDVGNLDQGTDTSATVSGLPTDGETLYARLWSKVNGEWLYKADSTYTACNNSSSIAEILSPASGSTLSSTTETFTWSDAGAEQYWLWIGTSAGGNDLGNLDQGTDTSATVSGLPGNGETLYVRLWSKVGGEWLYKSDSICTASGP
ncbi:MAG: hypothetical protein GY795_26905 [Desulfobacterales bacterium]|nr:hypothetical protein [Desulfobacterales bacterium]